MILRRILPLVAATAVFVAAPAALAAQLKHGDVNGDGIVSALDAQAILTAAVSLPLPQGYVVANGDANCDAATGALDAQIVLSFVIGLDVSQHCVGQAFGPGAITMTLTPTDTSVLINRGLRFRAILKDSAGATPQRPIAWSSSNTDLIAIDSTRGDTAWVSNKGLAYDAVATLTATADGVTRSTSIRVHRTYAGIIITPQKPDTLRQLNADYNFVARNRDSLGVVSGFPSAFWSVSDTTIATVTATAANTGVLRTKINGITWLRAVSATNSADMDSLRLVVQNPVLSSCSETGGTVYSSTTFTTPQTWTVANGPYFVNGTLTFSSGSSLTIQPGTLVCAGSGGYIRFNAGSRLTALGTAAQPIRFTTTSPASTWSGIQLGDNVGYITAPLADTSRLTNVRVENGSNGNGAIDGWHQHVVLLDSVVVRQSPYGGVSIRAPGSRMIRSRVDTVGLYSSSYTAVSLGRASLEESNIRVGTGSIGVELEEAGWVRQVTIVGSGTAIRQDCCADSARLNDVTITGTTGTAIVLDGGLIHPLSGNVVVSGGTGGVFRGGLGNFAHLYPDSAAQESLKNNGKDTVHIYYGTLINRTLPLRADLAWRMEGTIQVDTLAKLVVKPGATLDFQGGYLYFVRGGTLDARGTAGAPIRMRPRAGSYFYGLDFENPGQGTSPFSSAPVAESFLTNVRVDSALGVCCSGGFGYGAVVGADRHRLIIDSTVVRRSENGGVHLSARGSRIFRSVIDTTGAPTTSYAALGLGDSTVADDVTVRRSGQVGVDAAGTGAQLRNVRILNSVGYGMRAENGVLKGDSGAVVMEGNAYVGRFRLENLARLAPDSVTQRALFTSTTTDSVVVVTTGSLMADTITAIPQLRWQVEGTVAFDTLSHFKPRPGARIAAWNGGLYFRQGGTIDARGTASLPIRFYPAAAGANFYGLELANPGQGSSPFASAPVAQSYLINVRVDSASGMCCVNSFGYAAISAANRHRVLIDSARVRLSHNGAVHLGAWGSRISRSVIDTTGLPTTSYVALGLGDSTTADSVTVRRSGYIGVNAAGMGARLRKVEILNSVQYGLSAVNNPLLGDSGSVTMQGNQYAGRVLLQNLGLLAPDSASQRAWFSSTTTDSAIVITGGNLIGDTVTAIPQLRWQVEGSVIFDTLSHFRPRPGARIGGNNGGLYFRQGATIDARGTATRPIRFYPVATGVNFYGIELENAGAGSNPFSTAPRDTSLLVNVQIDSASGQCCVSGFGYAAVSANNRHVVRMDSARIRLAHNGAVHLAARGSSISRTVVDTTGLPTTGYPAIGLGDSVTVDSLVVRRSGQVGVRATGSWVRLQRLHVLNSIGYGLFGETGIFVGDSGNVTLTGNQYAARLRLENVALLMPDSVSQAKAVGNVSDILVVTGGTITNDTLTAIPLLRWQVEQEPVFGAGSEFRPKKGARITGSNSGITFQGGARLYAIGTATDTIRFYPAASNVNFYGLRMEGATQPDFPSTLAFARLDSVSGQSVTGGMNQVAAINVASGHVLNVSNTLFRRSLNGAVHLGSGSGSLTNVRIDTTGTGASLLTSYDAVRLGTNTSLSNVVVRRSGDVGIGLNSKSSSWTDVFIYDSKDIGILVEAGSDSLVLTDFVVDSATYYGIRVNAPAVTMSQCDVLSTQGSPGTNFLIAASGGTNVIISQCNIEGWLANGISSTGSTNTTASGNFWAVTRGGASSSPVTSATGAGTINSASPATVRYSH